MTHRSTQWMELHGWRLFGIAVILFAGGLLNDPPWKWYSAQQHFIGYGESYRVALNLFHEGEFANPFGSLRTGPTGHVAPAYPFLQSLLLKLFGEGSGGWLAIRMFAAGLQSAQFALLPWLARSLGWGAWTGVLAALFGILVKAPREELWEGHLTGLIVMVLVAWTHSGTRKAAILAGLAFLVQPAIAVVYFPWAWFERRRWLLIGVPLLISAPWIARNYFEVGGFTWIRSNLGIELHVSFNDCVPYGIRESERVGCFPTVHPNINGAEATAVRALGEYKYNQLQLATASTWIATHPAQAASLIAQRFWYFWFPSDSGWIGYREQRKRFATLHLFTILSFAGLWLAWSRREACVGLLTWWVAAFPLIYYLVQFETRYRLPLLWLTYLLSAFAVRNWAQNIRWRPSRVTIKDSIHATF